MDSVLWMSNNFTKNYLDTFNAFDVLKILEIYLKFKTKYANFMMTWIIFIIPHLPDISIKEMPQQSVVCLSNEQCRWIPILKSEIVS